jgi:hypothetical protein
MGRYFNGKSGVYYDRFNDKIVLLKEVESVQLYNRRTNEIKIVKRYDLLTNGIMVCKTTIKATSDLIILGEL